MGYQLLSDVTEVVTLCLIYSSAYHHSANPAERAIRTVKGLMKKCTKAKQSWRLALLEYLATPLDSKTPSPSELNGRKFGSMYPMFQISALSTLTNWLKDMMLSCSMIHKVTH